MLVATNYRIRCFFYKLHTLDHTLLWQKCLNNVHKDIFIEQRWRNAQLVQK